MRIEIRSLIADDWPRLWPMLKDMGVNGEHPDAQRERYVQLVADPRWVILGADADGELAGYAAVQDHGPHLRSGDDHRVARLHDLYVRPDLRLGGVGRALMTVVSRWARQRVRYLEWQAHRERAAPFYERLGYQGEPCPQPDYPTFEIDFRSTSGAGAGPSAGPFPGR
ncbi:GNAT family N-acetyltransferase [Micromonospora sp. NPDC052213]|uniref:GNAT family N-acetyltransferase n=1 Tax=Micromonospora sp. NPDC052213 TaxID=3155812 RepID=UPI00343A4BA9